MMDSLSPTLEESLRLLGVELSAGRQAARTAYLALLRKHKPEVDPEGFKRLRKAWETVSASLDGECSKRLWDAALREHEFPLSEAPAPASPQTARAPVEQEHGEDVGVGRIERVPPWMASSLESLVDSARAQGVVLDERRVCLGWERVPQVTFGYANALLAEGHVDLASELVIHQLSASRSQQAPPSVHPFVVLEFILDLAARSQVAACRRVTEALERRLITEGAEARMGDDIAAMWLLAREIAALPDAFPSHVRSSIANAVSAASLDTARSALERFSRDEPAQADVARALLYHRAPTLFRALSDALRVPAHEATRSMRPRAERWGAFAVMVTALMVLAWMASPQWQRAPWSSGVSASEDKGEGMSRATSIRRACAAHASPCPRLVWWVRELDAGRCVKPEDAYWTGLDGFRRTLALAVQEQYRELCERL